MKPAIDEGYLLEGGRRVTTQVIKCDYCSNTEHLRHSGSSVLPPEVAKKKFQQKGWQVGKKNACPACILKFKAINAQKGKTPKMATANESTVVNLQPTPREMQPADRRRVFRAVDEEWDDNRGRYSGNATDHTIATSLNVPRAWVEEIRRESFGTSADNDAIEEFSEELDASMTRVNTLVEQGLAIANKMDEEFKKLGAIKERFEKIRAAVGPKA